MWSVEGSILCIVMFPVRLPTDQNHLFELPVKVSDTVQLYTSGTLVAMLSLKQAIIFYSAAACSTVSTRAHAHTQHCSICCTKGGLLMLAPIIPTLVYS